MVIFYTHMAIWQYTLFLVPKNKYYLYDKNHINIQGFDGAEWWIDSKIKISDFEQFDDILGAGKSWSNDIVLKGNESSNCIEIVVAEEKIVDVSVRIDLRYDYNIFTTLLCSFSRNNELVFLLNSFELIEPDSVVLNRHINNYNTYKRFINKLNS